MTYTYVLYELRVKGGRMEGGKDVNEWEKVNVVWVTEKDRCLPS